MKVVLYNGTHSPGKLPLHFGCELVVNTFKEQLKRVQIELLDVIDIPDCVKNFPHFPSAERADLVLVNGEGSFHHNRRKDICEISKHFPSILCNTVYQSNSYKKEQLLKFKFISARESLSVKELKRIGLDADLIPDVIFTNKELLELKWRGGGGKGLIDHYDGLRTLQPADTFLGSLARHDQVASGSFHGAIACAVLGIPFSVWPSNTHKNQGLVSDMGLPSLCFKDKKSAMDGIPRETSSQISEYFQMAQKKINAFFENLHFFK